jgi:glycosyltransferase involved in cell wall biosynthesis
VSGRVDPGTPRLTVVTPVLNGAAFVEGCVQNVAEQNCELCEHIVVDGGSTDGTLALLDRLVETVPRLRVLVEPGMRQSSAMNAGIRASAGAIIGILNVDDFYSPGTLNRVLELFRSFTEPTLLVGNCAAWSGGRELRVNRPSDLSPEALLLGPRHRPFPSNPSAYFYDKKVHEIVGFYDEDDDFTMDLDFLLRAVASVRTEYRDEPWGNFRIHGGAKTVIDKASGRHRRRRRQVINRHRRRLPFAKRTALRCTLLALDARLGARLARWALVDPAGFRRARAAGLVLAVLRNAPEAASAAGRTSD